MNQIAKLFLRGSLINKTAKNLTPDQKSKVDALIAKITKDPEMQNGIHEFAIALRGTIKNEYNDANACFQEAMITFWRTAVDVLYGKHATDKNLWNTDKIVNCPSSLCGCSQTKPMCRKKVFQTWMFNYLKQIIRENTRTSQINKTKINGEIGYVISNIIATTLSNNNIKTNIVSQNDKYIIEPTRLTDKIKNKITSINDKYKEVEILITDKNYIEIIVKTNKMIEVTLRQRSYVKTLSTTQLNSYNNDSETRLEEDPTYFNCKRAIKMNNDVTSTDLINTISNRLDGKAKLVFEIIVNTPDDYHDKFAQLHKKNIADYLNISKIDVVKAFEIIKNECIAVGYVPETFYETH